MYELDSALLNPIGLVKSVIDVLALRAQWQILEQAVASNLCSGNDQSSVSPVDRMRRIRRQQDFRLRCHPGLCGAAGGMGTRTNLLVNGSDSDECDSVTGPRVQRRCPSPGPPAEGLCPAAASPDAFQREFEATLKSGEPGLPRQELNIVRALSTAPCLRCPSIRKLVCAFMPLNSNPIVTMFTITVGLHLSSSQCIRHHRASFPCSFCC